MNDSYNNNLPKIQQKKEKRKFIHLHLGVDSGV